MTVMRKILLLVQKVEVVLASFLSALPAIKTVFEIMFLQFPVDNYIAHRTVEDKELCLHTVVDVRAVLLRGPDNF